MGKWSCHKGTSAHKLIRYSKGLLSCFKGKFTFKDGLEYQEQNWDYCTAKDRRFYSERVYGFLSGETQLSNSNQTVPPGTLDVGDGYYDPKDSSIHEYTAGTIIRLPDEDEARWMRE